MFRNHPHRGSPLQTNDGHIVRRADGQCFGTCKTGYRWPCGERNGDNGIFDAWPKRCSKGQREHETRKSKKDIDNTHQCRINPAAHIACGGANDETNRRSDDSSQRHDVKRDARAIDKAAENIAPQFVRTKEMPP